MDKLLLEATKTGPTRQDVRRAKILAAVMAILANEGLDELTLERVGKKVKMARSHIVYYFKSRDELVEAAVRYATLSARDLIAKHISERGESKDWRVALRRYVEGNFRWIETQPDHVAVYTLLYYLAAIKPRYRKLHEEIRKVGYDFIDSILKNADLTPARRHAAVINIQGVLTGNLIDATTAHARPPFKERLAQTLAAIDPILTA
ncbi:TetR/AcrR family transcriptional regulator [bacterium]|nr:TetR/AcrR family transcriptional regulator [bacterium]